MQTRDPDASLRARIGGLCAERTQAEVARRTGTSLANVNRYLHGTRVPAHFCAALVQGLGVNPAWLLAGEGSALLADTNEGTRRMAGDILELVQAMNAVTRMRLGSLAGRHHLKVLRELNGALTRYEQLRERMNQHSRGMLADMLHELRDALARMDLTRARDIRPAAVQVARLCEDDVLRRDLEKLEAHIEYLSGDYTAAAVHQRRVFMHGLMQPELGEPEFEELVRYIITLSGLRRAPEALRIAEAAAALFRGREFASLPWLDYYAGSLNVQLGNLRPGMARMLETLPQLTGKRLAAAQSDLMFAMLQAGVMQVPAAIAYGEDIADKATNLLLFATYEEDARHLQLVCDYAASDRVQRVRGKPSALTYPFLALRALQGDARVIREWRQAMPKHPTELQRAELEIDLAQLHRLLGRAVQARRHAEAAHRKLNALPTDTPINRLTLATHYRNVLELGVESGRDAAAAFFRDHVDRGFGCFLGMVQTPKPEKQA